MRRRGGEGGRGVGRRRTACVVLVPPSAVWPSALSPLMPVSTLTLFCEVLRLIHNEKKRKIVCLLIGCLTSQQQASVSQGRICSDNFTCCHTETEVADQTFYLTQSQYTDTGPISPSADPITPGAWQSSHWSANF